MTTFDIVMPKMGESIQEATITKWFKKVGDTIEEEDVLLEIATDKVDSEIPSPVDGVVVKVLFDEGALVPVGEVIAVVDMDGGAPGLQMEEKSSNSEKKKTEEKNRNIEEIQPKEPISKIVSATGRFYSPLVKSIASKENVSIEELDKINGTGHNGRVKKEDLLKYISTRQKVAPIPSSIPTTASLPHVKVLEGDQVIKMDRMRKMIADHMVNSKHVSPHVTNFIETDVTGLVLWRNKIKDEFYKRERQKITFMPVFIEAVAKALKKFPGINASTDGDNIILRKNVNVGIAVALPTGNLIVPVIKNADQKSLLGITLEMNKLAVNARENKLNPDDIQGGTFTISNFGSFGNLTGTPVINQPQAAILATGTIEKKPAVLETETGDVIAIRHKMMLALTYDHRIIDGALAGSFLQHLANELGQFDTSTTV